MAALTRIQCLTDLASKWLFLFLLFSVSQPDSFSIDQMKFICWVQLIYLLGLGISIFLVPKGIPPPYLLSLALLAFGDLEQCHSNVVITFLMLKKRCNSLNSSQLWKTDCHFLSIFFRRV